MLRGTVLFFTVSKDGTAIFASTWITGKWTETDTHRINQQAVLPLMRGRDRLWLKSNNPLLCFVKACLGK